MQRPNFIYFLTDGHAVKIGFSNNVIKRMQNLQTCHHFELKLIGSILGSKADERELHDRFSEHRIRGEWFRPHREIFDFLEQKERRRLTIAHSEHRVNYKVEKYEKRTQNSDD